MLRGVAVGTDIPPDLNTSVGRFGGVGLKLFSSRSDVNNYYDIDFSINAWILGSGFPPLPVSRIPTSNCLQPM